MFPSSESNPIRVIDKTHASQGAAKPKREKIEKTLSQIRALHEQLNSQLYARPIERPQINSAEDAVDLLMPFLAGLGHEELWIMLLDSCNRVKCLIRLYVGTLNFTPIRTAEVFRQAVVEGAAAVLIGHNHPSGDPSPSPDDVAITRSIVQAGKLLDVEVVDHVVICPDRFVSLKERGLGFG